MTHRPQQRLGKGLSALLGDYAPGSQAPSLDSGEILRLPVQALKPNPFQPRHEIDREQLDRLIGSIRENGLLQPLVVRPAGEGAWEIVAGERRWRAVGELGWSNVPAVVREVDDGTMLVLALVENVQREELSPIEEARAYRRLLDEFGLTQSQVAEMVGRDRSTVANTLRLLALPEPVLKLLADGLLSAGHARAVLAVEDESEAIRLAREAVENGWSVREIEGRARAAARSEAPRPDRSAGRTPAADPYARRAEEELGRTLGTAVRVRLAGKTRGRIEIPFAGSDEFDHILEAILGARVRELRD